MEKICCLKRLKKYFLKIFKGPYTQHRSSDGDCWGHVGVVVVEGLSKRKRKRTDGHEQYYGDKWGEGVSDGGGGGHRGDDW